MKKQNRKWLWLVLVGAAVLTVGVLAALFPGIEAQTSPDNPDPQMRSRHYKADMNAVRKSILEIIPQLRTYGSHWQIATYEGLVAISSGNSHKINDGIVGSQRKVIAEVPVLVFTDQLEVTLRAEKSFTRVDVHSQTRIHGKSDFGENRRHVLQLLSALDGKLKSKQN